MLKAHPLETLIEHYLEEKDITIGTREVYQTILKQYLNYLKHHHIVYASTDDVKRYLERIRNKGYSTRWLRHHITVLKGLYHDLSLHQRRLGLPQAYAVNIMEPIKNVRIETEIAKPILTTQQAKHLILFLKDHRKHVWQYRDYAMVYLMITTGLRSVELRRARINDFKVIHGEHILYVQGKGRSASDEFVKISEGLRVAIKEYLIKRKDQNPYLFVSRSKRSKQPLTRTIFHGIFKRILRDSGLTDTCVTAHSLRHTAATFNLKRGGSLEETKQLLRHTNMANTLIYAHHEDAKNEKTASKLESFILGEE